MTKISGKVISVKPVPLSRAAKVITIFASVDNGSSAAVSTYLKRTADAFSRLVNFHGSKSIINSSDVERNPDVAEEQDLKFRETKEEKGVDLVVDEGKKNNEKKKKKRKEKSGEDDKLNEKTSSKSIKTSDVVRNSNAAEDQDPKVKEGKSIDLVVEGGQNKKKKRKKRKEKNGEDDNLNEKTSKKKRRSSPSP